MKSNMPVLHLSQSNLQDFEDCPRRFQLKVIDNISWPAAYLEPLSRLEQATDLGNKFHHLCQQYFSGIDSGDLIHNISNPDLINIWESFVPFANDLRNGNLFTEIILSTPMLGHHLIAKYDLVIKTSADKFVIYDWKTSTKKPSRTQVGQRFQTFLYPYILLKTGNSLFKTDQPSPNDIDMIYWYPLSSDPEEIFPYSEILYSENADQLTKLIMKINNFIETSEVFPLTEDHSLCQKCIYRSLCERGIHGGEFDLFTEIDQEDLSGLHFDLDKILENKF